MMQGARGRTSLRLQENLVLRPRPEGKQVAGARMRRPEVGQEVWAHECKGPVAERKVLGAERGSAGPAQTAGGPGGGGAGQGDSVAGAGGDRQDAPVRPG